MKIRIANSLLKSVGVGWPRSMDDRLWGIEALVHRYCVSIEDFFSENVNKTLQVNPLLAATALKSIVEGQGIKTVRVSYAPVKSKLKRIGYRFWISYQLPGSTRLIKIRAGIYD